MPKRSTLTWLSLLLIGLCCSMLGSVALASSADGIQVYQNHLEPEHKQKLADDIARYRNADNLWDALKDSFTLDHEENNPAVQKKIAWFMNNQDFLLRATTRAAPYLYYILQETKKRNLPTELVLLPIIESGYNPFATSNVGAAGIWQMMPGTASDEGVIQDWGFDGRRDVISSTRGALNYLAYLQNFFGGNWLLAVAAYNTGAGNVLAAIRRNVRDGEPTDFWSLPVAQQTRDYVPSLLALAVIISHPDQYPIYFPPVHNAPYLAEVDVGSSISLDTAARLAGLSFERMKALNPGFTHGTASSKLVVPIENVEQLTENLSHSSFHHPVIDWLHYRVRTGDTLFAVARKFNITVASLRKLNRLSRNSPLHHGTELLIPHHEVAQPAVDDDNAPETEVASNNTAQNTNSTTTTGNTPALILSSADNPAPTHYSLQPGDTLYMVRHGDTIEKIARHFHLAATTIRVTNLLSNTRLAEGQRLIIPTHLNS